jgi:hypothetical protein
MGEESEDDEGEVVDLNNYKGIHFTEEPNSKFQCPDTGAHFRYEDVCSRLLKAAQQLGQKSIIDDFIHVSYYQSFKILNSFSLV